MADPVRDVGSAQGVEKKSKRELDPTRTIVVIVVVLYLTCQMLLAVFTIYRKSPDGYSDDEDLPIDSPGEINSDVEHMQSFCNRGQTNIVLDREDGTESNDSETKRNSALRSGLKDDSFRPNNTGLLASHVHSVVEKTLNASDMCGIKVTYYVCDSGTETQTYIHNRVSGSTTDEEEIDPAQIEDMTKFVDESLGYEIVIAYRECSGNIETENRDLMRVVVEVLKILLPLPILTTLLVYMYLPPLRKLQGKIIVCKLSSDLVYCLWPWYEDESSPSLLLLCSCVAGITWTTILGYDLWSTVTDPLPSSRRAGSGRRFVYYSLIGWGHTAVFATVAILAHITLHKWFRVFIECELYIVYIFMNLINLAFFAFTVKNIKRHNARSLTLVKDGRKGKTASGLNLYLKISAHMGLISFVFENIDVCMIIFVDYNDKLMQAVLLGFSFLDNTIYFVVLVCNEKVLGLLKNKRTSTSSFR